jgi:hypothetical protein
MSMWIQPGEQPSSPWPAHSLVPPSPCSAASGSRSGMRRSPKRTAGTFCGRPASTASRKNSHRDRLPALGKPAASHDQRHVLPTQRLGQAGADRLAASSSNGRNPIRDRQHRSHPTRRDVARRRSRCPKALGSTRGCRRVRASGCGRNTPGRGRNTPELFNLIRARIGLSQETTLTGYGNDPNSPSRTCSPCIVAIQSRYPSSRGR